jgi:hypothetical protein
MPQYTQLGVGSLASVVAAEELTPRSAYGTEPMTVAVSTLSFAGGATTAAAAPGVAASIEPARTSDARVGHTRDPMAFPPSLQPIR